MDLLWAPWGIPTPVAEYRFDKVRRWRFDYVWVGNRVALEIEGGIWNRGAHVRGGHFISDMEKYNAATKQGWRVFRFQPKDLKTGKAQTFLKEVLK